MIEEETRTSREKYIPASFSKGQVMRGLGYYRGALVVHYTIGSERQIPKELRHVGDELGVAPAVNHAECQLPVEPPEKPNGIALIAKVEGYLEPVSFASHQCKQCPALPRCNLTKSELFPLLPKETYG